MKITEEIAELERRTALDWNPSPATILQRILVDIAIVRRECPEIPETKIPVNRDCMNIWSLGLGPIGQRKRFFLGLTIPAAIKKARAALDTADTR